jgi:flagellar biosynthesis anti-sigma factor FlgM
MDIRSSLEGLRTLLGVDSATPAATQSKGATGKAGSNFENDMATLSAAASQVSQSSTGDSVRMDKVAQIQAVLAAGTYSVPASAVASKLVDSMLGGH